MHIRGEHSLKGIFLGDWGEKIRVASFQNSFHLKETDGWGSTDTSCSLENFVLNLVLSALCSKSRKQLGSEVELWGPHTMESVTVVDPCDNAGVGVTWWSVVVACAKDQESGACHVWLRHVSWPLCTLVSSLEKKWILQIFQSSYWADPQLTSNCIMFLHIFIVYFTYNVCKNCIPCQAWNVPKLSSAIRLQPRFLQEKEEKNFRTFILWQGF